MKTILYIIVSISLFCLHWHFTIKPQEYARATPSRIVSKEIKDLMEYHGPYHDYTIDSDGRLVLHREEDIILTDHSVTQE